MAMLHPQGANWLLGGRRPVPMGNSHPNLAPCDKYPTRTGEIFLACGNDGQFRKLVGELGRPELATDERFRSNSQRVTNVEALRTEMRAAFVNTDGIGLATRLLALGVPAGPVLPVDLALTAPQAEARGAIAEHEDYRGIATPIHLSRTPDRVRGGPPRFAEDAEAILRQHGYTQNEIDAFRSSGVTPQQRKR